MLQSIFGFLPWSRKAAHNHAPDIKSFQVSCDSLSSSDGSDDGQPIKTKKSKKILKRRIASSRVRKNKEEAGSAAKLVCYLCGQQVQRHSLLSHLDGCMTSWTRREETKSVEERIPMPEKPVLLEQDLPENPAEIEEFNKTMRSIWLKATNIRCKRCKKVFKAGAYHKHVKTCGQPSPKLIVEESNDSNSKKVKRVIRKTKSMTEKVSPWIAKAAEKAERNKNIGTPNSQAVEKGQAKKKITAGLKKLRDVITKPIERQRSDSAREIPMEADVAKSQSKSFSVRRTKDTAASSDFSAQPDRSSKSTSERTSDSRRPKESATLAESLKNLKTRPPNRPIDRKPKSARERSYAQATVASSMRLKSHIEQTRQVAESAETSESREFGKSASFPAKGPRGFTCYLCGRQFGSASLSIHVRQCRQLWEDREMLKRRMRERRPLPTPPPEMSDPLPTAKSEIRDFNDSMLAFWEARALHHCPHCARTFTTEAFEKHQRVCTAVTPGGPNGLSKHRPVATDTTTAPLASSSSTDSAYTDSGPLHYCCYVCGRQYGSQSLFLHLPRCQKLWEDREATKPRKQDRRPLPQPPPQMEAFPDITLPTDREEVLAFNNAMYEYWDKVSLYTCLRCGRSFNEESFEKHQKLCNGEGPMTKRTELDKQASKCDDRLRHTEAAASGTHDNYKFYSEPIHYVCYLCGRHFGSKSLSIHIPQCEKRWAADEANFDRPLPPCPQELDVECLPTQPSEIARFNTIMTQHWESHALIKCKTCSRTFRPEALEKHQKHCAASHS